MNCEQLILGNIITLDTNKMFAEAMAVKEGRIVYLGSEEIARTLCDENTQILDYEDNVIYPGFIDSHCHGLLAGQRLVWECDLKPGESMEDYMELLKEYIEKYPDRDCYKGSGWAFYDKPKASMIDSVCADKPVILTSIDNHSVWINSIALKECRIDKEKAKELGYDLVHVDEEGNPTGWLSETATNIVREVYKVTVEEMKEGILAWQDFAFSQGLTAVGEALVDILEDGEEAYHELNKEGKLKLRTFAYYSGAKLLKENNLYGLSDNIIELSERVDSDYFKIAGAKIILDGVVEAHTAYLKEEYTDKPGHYGILNINEQETLDKHVLLLNEKGIPVHTHAIGDGAISMIVNSYEKAELETSNFDIRNSVCHLQYMDESDFKRFADYNIIAVVAPLWVPIDHTLFDNEVKYLGVDRAWNCYPIKALEDAGATLCFHTDYPVSRSIDAAEQIYSAVKRRNPNMGPETVKNPEEAISAYSSILASTLNCAYLWREEDNLGTLAIGKIANATVFSDDFLRAEELNKIEDIKLVATIVDGEEVYRNE